MVSCQMPLKFLASSSLIRLCFTFEDGCQKRQDDVKREHVLPSGSWKEYKLVGAQKTCALESSEGRAAASTSNPVVSYGEYASDSIQVVAEIKLQAALDEKSLQTLFKSDKARVFVDFHSFKRSQAIHLHVEEILDGQVLREAEDFAELISPVFRVVLQGASGDKVTDGQTVDLIVELEDVGSKLNTDSLVFIKKSDELDSMWCGVSGGTFDLVPSESGKGLLLRARVATDSFSSWGVAKCVTSKWQRTTLRVTVGENCGLLFIPEHQWGAIRFRKTKTRSVKILPRREIR
jgi:hypothetical protein